MPSGKNSLAVKKYSAFKKRVIEGSGDLNLEPFE
jgi:hypothetical protein